MPFPRTGSLMMIIVDHGRVFCVETTICSLRQKPMSQDDNAGTIFGRIARYLFLEVIKGHQKKALSVSKQLQKLCLGAALHDCTIVNQSATTLKAENLPGQKEGKSDQ